MPGTATQAYKQVIELEDLDNAGSYIDYSSWFHDGTFTISRDPIDTTTFGNDGYTESIPGLKNGSLAISYFTDSTYRSFMLAALNRDTSFGVKIYPEGKVDGKDVWSFQGFLTGGGDGGAVAAAGGGQASIKMTGAPTKTTYSA